MASEKKFGLLRKILAMLGLSSRSADQVVDFTLDLLAGEGKGDGERVNVPEFPYHLRDHFLSPAELSFFNVLRTAVNGRAVICCKATLRDVFYVKRGDDSSRYAVYTNKIDRKHVDFLLCDSATMRPLLGIELDDKSHERPDRRERDTFVDGVFAAAKLPLLHVPVRRSYAMDELEAQLAPHLGAAKALVQKMPVETSVQPDPTSDVGQASQSAKCPKCGGEMILRTAKSGANAGNKFWGCSNFPRCRTMLPYQAEHV